MPFRVWELIESRLLSGERIAQSCRDGQRLSEAIAMRASTASATLADA
jgi:hypothetical protein